MSNCLESPKTALNVFSGLSAVANVYLNGRSARPPAALAGRPSFANSTTMPTSVTWPAAFFLYSKLLM